MTDQHDRDDPSADDDDTPQDLAKLLLEKVDARIEARVGELEARIRRLEEKEETAGPPPSYDADATE